MSELKDETNNNKQFMSKIFIAGSLSPEKVEKQMREDSLLTCSF